MVDDASDASDSARIEVRTFLIADGRIVEFTFFLDTERVFPLFGLPTRLGA